MHVDQIVRSDLEKIWPEVIPNDGLMLVLDVSLQSVQSLLGNLPRDKRAKRFRGLDGTLVSQARQRQRDCYPRNLQLLAQMAAARQTLPRTQLPGEDHTPYLLENLGLKIEFRVSIDLERKLHVVLPMDL
jgi:hypothetical protein